MKRQTGMGMAITIAALTTITAHAQSSVMLYGIIDTGIGYQSSQVSTLGATSGGHSAIRMINGVWAGSRFGFKGSEDLGGGTQAIFQLEAGLNSATGAAGQFASAMFGRQAWAGLTHPAYGTLTLGRQYTSYYTLLSPYSPTNWLTGYYGAHPGDIDSLDTLYRANNSVVYTSPSVHGLTVSGSYALGGVPGSVGQGSTWSAAVQYTNGPFGIGGGFQRINNSTPGGGAWGADSTTSNGGAQTALSAINNGYATAQAQQRMAVAGDWQFTPNLDLSLSYSNVQYIPGSGSKFYDEAIFNTVAAVLHWKAMPALDLAGGYAYTHAARANGITDSARYSQFTLSQFYSFSKRTSLYALEACQHANGKTLGTGGAGNIIDATASIGDGGNGTPASSRSQFAVGVGIVTKF